MSFLAPFWLAVAGVVAAGVLVAHLFSTNVPPREVLPTVRFVPESAPLAVLRTRRLTDAWLLLLRVIAVLLLGLALAGAHVPRDGPARVVVVDVSRAMGSGGGDAIDLAAEGAGATAAESAEDHASIMIAFDSAARVIDEDVLDTLRPSSARGSLSTGLIAAHRAIAHVTQGREDIELVIVSPLVREEIDSATTALIALWEGPVRLARRRAASVRQHLFTVELRAGGDDPVAASIAGIEPSNDTDSARAVRVVRDVAVDARDSAFARDGALLVLWPRTFMSSVSSAPSAVQALRPRATIDTIGAFATARHTVVGAFARTHQPREGRVIARWMDGEPAATEVALGAGCLREVAIPVDPVGDLALRDSFRGAVRALLEPCGGARDVTPVPDSLLIARERTALATAGVPGTGSRLPVLLALLALLAIAAEQLLRRTRGSAA